MNEIEFNKEKEKLDETLEKLHIFKEIAKKFNQTKIDKIIRNNFIYFFLFKLLTIHLNLRQRKA